MPITCQWDDEGKGTILFQVENRWTWDDFYQAMDQAHGMLDESSQPYVDYILHMTGNLFPDNVLSHLQRVTKESHPKSRMMIVVGAGNFTNALFKMMGRITPNRMQRIRFTASLEEARQIILANRSDTIHTRPRGM